MSPVMRVSLRVEKVKRNVRRGKRSSTCEELKDWESFFEVTRTIALRRIISERHKMKTLIAIDLLRRVIIPSPENQSDL